MADLRQAVDSPAQGCREAPNEIARVQVGNGWQQAGQAVTAQRAVRDTHAHTFTTKLRPILWQEVALAELRQLSSELCI